MAGTYVEGDYHHLRLMTPRNVLLMACGMAGFVGWELANAELLALAAGAFAILAISAFSASRLLDGVQVRRNHHPRAFEEQNVTVDLAFRTGDRSPHVSLIEVEDIFPPSLGYKLRSLVTSTIRPGVGLELRFDPACQHKRGLYAIGPVTIRAADPLGFFRREAIVECFTQLLVYPNSIELNEADLLGEGVLRHVGSETTRRSGFSEEFIGVREYRPGDPPRVVHWRSTARHGRLMVKEFQEPVTTRVSIFLDLGRKGLVGLGDQTSVEYGIKAAAAVARRAHALSHEIELFAIGDTVEHLAPGAGMTQLLALLDRLAFLKPSGEHSFPAVALDLAHALPRGATAVFIAGATTIEGDAHALLLDALVGHGILPIMVLIDDRAFIKVFGDQERSHARARSIESIARDLAARGAVVKVIRKARSIAEALAQGLERNEAAPP